MSDVHFRTFWRQGKEFKKYKSEGNYRKQQIGNSLKEGKKSPGFDNDKVMVANFIAQWTLDFMSCLLQTFLRWLEKYKEY